MQIYSVNQTTNYNLMPLRKQNKSHKTNVLMPAMNSDAITANYNKVNVNFKAKQPNCPLLKDFPTIMEKWLAELDIDKRTIQSCNAFWQKAIEETPQIKEYIKQLTPSIGSTSFIMQGHNNANWKFSPHINQQVSLLDEESIPVAYYEINYTLDGKIISEDGYRK